MKPLAVILFLSVSPAAAQISFPAPAADTSSLATKSDVAAAQAAAAAAVKTVNGTTPDGAGNVPLPTTFTGTTCSGCAMSSPVFTGTATLNGTALATTASITSALAATVTAVNGVAPVSGNVPLTIGSVGNVSGLAYFHRYSGVTLTIPAVGIGGTGTATATVPGTAAGDQCFVAPTSTTTLLSYIMASGWVSVAGTVKVALAAPSVVAISATTVSVNMLCAQ